MTQTLFLGDPVLAFDKVLILSLATSRESWCSSGTDVTASVPLYLSLTWSARVLQDRSRCG